MERNMIVFILFVGLSIVTNINGLIINKNRIHSLSSRFAYNKVAYYNTNPLNNNLEVKWDLSRGIIKSTIVTLSIFFMFTSPSISAVGEGGLPDGNYEVQFLLLSISMT